MRRKQYKRVMAKIAEDRKELLEMKKSMAGEIFSQVCDEVCRDYYSKFESDTRNFALRMQEENREHIEAEMIDEVFEKEKWIDNFKRKTFDCGEWERFHDSGIPLSCNELAQYISQRFNRGSKTWCLQHMSDSKLGDLVEKSLVEKLDEEVDKEMLEKGDEEFMREMKLTFESDFSTLWLPIIYTDVAKRCLNRAFRTIFSKNHSDIYCKAKVAAIDLWHKRKDDTELSEFLIQELEKSGVYISEKISELFKEDFMLTLRKNFAFFNKRVPYEMRSKNLERRDWAIKELEKSQADEKDSVEKSKRTLIENAKIEIQRIYQDYEEDITDGYENNDIEFEAYLCCTGVVDLYPRFKGSRKDPLFNSLTDNYELWFRQRELEKSKAGQVFSQVCDKMFLDYYHKLQQEDLDYAVWVEEENRDDIETDVFDEIFEEELWIENFNRKKFDCGQHKRFHDSGKPLTCSELGKQFGKEQAPNEEGYEYWCLQHMTNSQFGDLVKTTMEETFKEEVNKTILEWAKEKCNKEYEYAFGIGYSPLVLPTIYIEVDGRSRRKAFGTLFLEKDSKIYEDAKQTAVRNWHESKYKKEVSDFLIEELEVLGVHVSDEIRKIFKNDFIHSFKKKFSSFKERVPCEVRSKNSEKRALAIKRLEKIETAEKDSINKSLIEHARIQIEKIYQKYEEKITDSYKNSNIQFEDFLSFSKIVENYPSFEGPFENPLLHGIPDNYDSWFRKFCNEIELSKEKCACYSCINNLHMTDECERVIRQRKLEMFIRTCPLCQQNIDFRRFDENTHFEIDH